MLLLYKQAESLIGDLKSHLHWLHCSCS